MINIIKEFASESEVLTDYINDLKWIVAHIDRVIE